MSDHARHEESIGAYLLGALPELEHQAFERHVMACDACRDEIVMLRPAVVALPHAVEQLVPPRSLRQSLMREVEAEARVRALTAGETAAQRRSRRSRAAMRRVGLGGFRLGPALAGAAASVALLAGGGLAGYEAGRDETPSPQLAQARTIDARADRSRLPEASGSLLVPAAAPGAMPVLRVQGVPPPRGGRVLQVWLRRGGEVVPAGVFTVRADGTGQAVITDPLDGVDAVMVTRERAGGAAAPTEVPVLSVRMN